MSARPPRGLNRNPGRDHRAQPIVGRIIDDRPRWLRKESAECCVARALPDGRPVIGFCGLGCLRRLERLTWQDREGT